MSAEEIVRAYIAALDQAREAANRSVLDGTVSCQTCRALLLEENAADHYRWHYAGQRVDHSVARAMIEMHEK
jgi:hypothetical protein